MLQAALDDGKFGDRMPVVCRAISKKGREYNTVKKIMEMLAKYAPALIEWDKSAGLQGLYAAHLTQAFFDVIDHDLKVWLELHRLGFASDLDIQELQMVRELLYKYYGKLDRLVA